MKQPGTSAPAESQVMSAGMKHQPRRQVLLLVVPHREPARQLLGGIASYAREHANWTFFTGQPLAPTKEIPPGWRGHGIIGDIVLEPLADQVRGLGVPVVNLRDTHGLPAVAHDGLAAGELAAAHLMGLGLRHFAYFTHPLRWDSQRLISFRDAVQRENCTCAVSLAYHLTGDQSLSLPRVRREMIRWLEKLPKPVGIVTQDDVGAWAIADLCREGGLAVPEQVAILAGSNDDLICTMFSPSLSSIAHDDHRRGYEAAGLLDRLMRGESVAQQTILVPPVGIRARESTDILPYGDAVVVRAMRLIRMQAHKGIQVHEICQAVSLSRAALDKRFVREVGHPVAAEIRRQRLRHAQWLLRSTRLSQTQIAREAGFRTVQYMALRFRQSLGISPGQYRLQAR